MELKQIKELMSAMERTGVTKINIKEKNYEVALERENTKVVHINHPPFAVDHNYMLPVSNAQAFIRDAAMHTTAASIDSQQQTKASSFGAIENTANKDAVGNFITSPMIGTFYIKPSPDAADFVKVGDSIKADSVACIIEAMKVMNEIKAGLQGTVAEVLVQNGQPVEFGTKLFRLN